MERKHHLNFCEACGHKLSGDEDVCPFCAYRLLDHEIRIHDAHPADMDAGELSVDAGKPVSSDISKEILCPQCNEGLDGDENVCPNCGLRLKAIETIIEKSSAQADDHVITAIEKDDTGARLTTQHVIPEKVIQDEQIRTRAKISGRRNKRNALIVAVVALILAVSFLAVLQFTGTISLPGFRSVPENMPPEDQQSPPVVSYYFCYATAVINNKFNVVISDVFTREEDDNSVMTIAGDFVNSVWLKYPKDVESFKPVLCKKYSNFEQANRERLKLQSSYRKKHYRLREVNM